MKGYTCERSVVATVADTEQTWTECVIVVRSEGYCQVMQVALERRLQQALRRLLALTPTPGRGKRQIQDEKALVSAAAPTGRNARS